MEITPCLIPSLSAMKNFTQLRARPVRCCPKLWSLDFTRDTGTMKLTWLLTWRLLSLLLLRNLSTWIACVSPTLIGQTTVPRLLQSPKERGRFTQELNMRRYRPQPGRPYTLQKHKRTLVPKVVLMKIYLKRRNLAEGKARAREQASTHIGLANSSDVEVILPQLQPPDAKVEAEGKEYMGLKISLSEVRST